MHYCGGKPQLKRDIWLLMVLLIHMQLFMPLSTIKSITKEDKEGNEVPEDHSFTVVTF